MKKIITPFLICLIFLPGIIFADDLVELPDSPLFEILGRLTHWLWVALLAIAVLFIIIAAYFFATAFGNPEQIKKGRDIILYVLIGVIVAAMAYGIVGILRYIAEGPAITP